MKLSAPFSTSVLGTVCALALLSGCGGDEAELPGALSVPVPPKAREAVVGPNSDTYASFEMPASSSYKEVLDFYDKQMPEGEDWRGWRYCETRGGRGPTDTYLTRLYRVGREALDVSVIWEKGQVPPAGGIIQRIKLSPSAEPC